MIDFIDTDVLYSPGFVLLVLGSLSATAIGFVWSGQMGWERLPIWQLILIMGGELVACYYFAAKA